MKSLILLVCNIDDHIQLCALVDFYLGVMFEV